MCWPKVSVIWVNYNSLKEINLVLKSLEALLNLDYPIDRYELIIIDNASIDGSFEKVKSFLENGNTLRKKIIKLDKNLGFTGGNNIGFKVRDAESKYVVLVNNDCIINPDSLRFYVEIMEQCHKIGALQGIILRYYDNFIDSAGIYLTDLFTMHSLSNRLILSMKDPLVCTAVEGTFPIYRISALKEALEEEKIFEETFFGMHEDIFTGLYLWSAGYISAVLPKIVAKHKRGTTWLRSTSLYLSLRNRIAIMNALSYKIAKSFHTFLVLKKLLTNPSRVSIPIFIHAIRGALKITRRLKERNLCKKSFLNAPIIKIPNKTKLLAFLLSRTIDNYVEEWFNRNIEKLTFKWKSNQA